jgi:hypothetical protein
MRKMTDRSAYAYARADVAAAAEAAHRALDDVDDSWHLACMEPDEDASCPPGCRRGHQARAMLVEDVMPAVLDSLVESGWTPPNGEVEMRRVPTTFTTFRFVVGRDGTSNG